MRLILLLALTVTSFAQSWYKVATPGDIVTSTGTSTFRAGAATCFTDNFSGVMTRFATTWGNLTNVYKVSDTCPSGTVEEIDVQQTSVAQSFIVNNSVVTVPAISDVPPIPVIFNGTKYSCSSIVLDNTGTLTLTCK